MRLIVIALGMLFFVACGTEEVVEDTPTNDPGTVAISIESPQTSAVENGEVLEHYDNGQVKIKGWMMDGKRIDDWVSYHSNGNKASESHYNNGLLDGKTVSYYPNGNIRYIGYYSKGVKAGTWQLFKEDGTPDREEKFDL